ncbi:MAG TPA: hypothetical protein VMS96_03175 [Terriglobales bacterium]|nr:hypothetical protein [Terriglobales bacterium]
MNSRRAIVIAILALLLPLFALAQNQPQEEQPKVWGDYVVRGSVEFGGHIAESEGSEQMYSTLVDLHSGPRLLGQELTMQSRTRVGGLFDNLYSSSFGFGGDPNGMARLRLEKDHWYNFVALYRRDKNIFDYNLFANPMNLNPGITTCGVGCTNAFTPSALPWYSNTTRLMAETRNMGDFSLTLFPQSKVSVRLGYARNATYGAMYTTLEAPLRTILSQDSQWKSDRYQGGVDLKFLPRTTISLDFFFEHDKNDIGFTDASDILYTLGIGPAGAPQQILFNGQPQPVDIGLLLPPLAGTASCAGANTQSNFTGGLFLMSSGCNGILLNTGTGGPYFRHGNVRTDIPTGQLSFQSSYFHNLDLSGSIVYSSASSDYLNFTEFAHYGSAAVPATPVQPPPVVPPVPPLVTTSNSSLFLINGAPNADRMTANADFGVTYHISKSLSVSDKFRWVNWRQHGFDDESRYGCFLNSTTYATAAGTTGTFRSLLNPCFSGILDLINPSGGGLITTCPTAGPVPAGCPAAGLNQAQGSVALGAGNYLQTLANSALVGERSYFNTFKVNWQPTRRFSAYVGYRFARRSFQDGNAGLTGTLSSVTSNFVNDGTGNPPTTPNCNTATPTAGCDLATGIATVSGEVDSAQINQHTLLFGVVVRPVDAWRINGDVELLSSDSGFFTNIYPRHQQRMRLYNTFKLNPWLSFNAGVHLVETRNDYAPGEEVEGTSTPLFPSSTIFPVYGHKDHWRYYTLGATMTRSRVTLDVGWTMLDQEINSDTCMPMPDTAFTGSITAPLACALGSTSRALRLDYQENTHSGYTHVSFQPVKRLTVNLGYEITGDAGTTNWLRADNGTPLLVVGDIFGNSPALAGNPVTPCPGPSSGTGCLFLGPFPNQPLGPQATTWHKATAGLAVEVVRSVEFKGMWNYYDYNGKDHTPGLENLQVVAPRDFHANVGTLSLRYSF